MSRRHLMLAVCIACAAAAPPLAAQEHGHGHDEGHAHAMHAEEARDGLHVVDFEEFGVTLGTAGPADVDVAIELPAEVRPNADRLSHLAAPFPGVVRSVEKTVGDAVGAGDVLAIIESDTLARYPLKAAFAGSVIDKHVTPGETVSREDRLFIIADLSTVWIEIDVYLDILPRVREGQAVHLATTVGEIEADGTLSYVSPVVDPTTRTATARVVLSNADGRWRPGSFVTASLSNPLPAQVVVMRRALQTVEGNRVVFVVEGDRFESRPVTIGNLGRTRAEIRDGLAAGERYADENSFLLKADLLKGEAEHEH